MIPTPKRQYGLDPMAEKPWAICLMRGMYHCGMLHHGRSPCETHTTGPQEDREERHGITSAYLRHG
jgi:hypothetical protein